MAAWASQGHAMRRRTGAPSNTVEAVGNMKNRNHATSNEAFEAASAAGSPRVAMGMSAYAATPTPALQGTLVPKKNAQAGDPTAGGKANRANIERVGAQYRITVPYTPTIDPAAGPTMASARLVPSVAGSNANFQAGEAASY